MEENKIKITCPNCDRTDYYKEKPKYCAFCGANLQENSNNQSK